MLLLAPFGRSAATISEHTCRVLSRIYRLGKKFRVAEGNSLPRRVRGQAPSETFWNDYALRCHLVHFETQFWECYSVCKDLVAFGWSLQYSYLYTVMITIFLGGKLGILGRGSFYPSNTLDRTLTYGDFAREKHTCVRRELQRRPALVWRSSCSYFRLSVCYSK